MKLIAREVPGGWVVDITENDRTLYTSPKPQTYQSAALSAARLWLKNGRRKSATKK